MINKIIGEIEKLYKDIYFSFPLTNICVFIITICCMLGIDIDVISDIALITCFFSVSCYCIEIKKGNKIYYVFSFVVSILLWFFSKYDNLIGINGYIDKLSLTYIIVLIIYSIYCNYKNSNKEFSLYLENIYRSVLKVSFIYAVLALCIWMIISIFNYLIVDIIDESVILDIEIFICGMYYVSNLLCVLNGKNKNEGVFFKTLIKKILNPLLYIAILIIYLFIIRLFIDGDIDWEYVFYIVSNLLLFGAPIIMMSSSYKENKLVDRINNYSSYLFVPLVLLQVYILIYNFNILGINEDVYMWILIVIFEIIYLIYNIKKIDYGNLLILLMIMIVVTNIVPFINMDELCLYSQYNNLSIYNKKDKYTDNEKRRIYNAYDYFKYRNDEYLDELGITEEDEKVIVTFDEDYEEYKDLYEDTSSKYDNIIGNVEKDSIDISGYDRISKFNISKYGLDVGYIDKLIVKYENEDIYIDFKDISISYYENKDNIYEYFKDNNTIILDNKYKLVLTYVDISYKNDIIEDYVIRGYILVKND